MIAFRIVLWISLWIILFLFFSYTKRIVNSTISESYFLRFLSVIFSSSSICYYYLTYIYILIMLSSRSLKAFNGLNRKFYDFPPGAVLFPSPRAASRRVNKSGELNINSLIESFFKTNLPISDVYIKLSFIRAAGLHQPRPRSLRTKRLLSRCSYCAGFLFASLSLPLTQLLHIVQERCSSGIAFLRGINVSSFFFPRLRFNPARSKFYKYSCKRTFYLKGAIT